MPQWGDITYTYDTGTDNRGRLMDLTDPQGSTAWSYDSQGRITQRRQQLDGFDLSLNYSYDPQGRILQLTYPSGKAVTFGYDPAGWINRVQADGETIVEQLSYHPFGPVTAWTWGSGALHSRSLDLDGRLSAFPLNGVTHSVSYDAASRITGIIGSEAKSYGYDALDRLTSATAPGINQTYSYDPNGNRLIETLGAQTTNYGYTADSNLLQSRTQGTTQNYTHDPAGNLIDDGAHTYTYDARGRMVQSATGALTTSYRYNGLGERVSKTAPGSTAVSRRFVYDESGHLIGEYDGAGTVIQETVYLGDLPIAILSGTNTIHYLHADQINTPRAITDTQGTVRWKWDGDAFGVGPPDQNPDGDGVGFVYNPRMPGQYYDAETGLHYNYFRDYDPTSGRYIQSDPIGLLGGPNTYGYARGNPILYVDPDGQNVLQGILQGGRAGAQAGAPFGPTGAATGAAIGGLIGGLAGLALSELIDTGDDANSDVTCPPEDNEDIDCDEWLDLLNRDYRNIQLLERAGGAMELAKKQHNKSVALFCRVCPSQCTQAKRF